MATPLGAVEVDSEFATFLVNNSEFFKSDEVAHAYEHSIEVQIPFQLIYISSGSGLGYHHAKVSATGRGAGLTDRTLMRS